VQSIQYSLCLLERSLGSRCPLIFIRELLRLLAVCFFRADTSLAPVMITKTGREIFRLGMLPNAGHA